MDLMTSTRVSVLQSIFPVDGDLLHIRFDQIVSTSGGDRGGGMIIWRGWISGGGAAVASAGGWR